LSTEIIGNNLIKKIKNIFEQVGFVISLIGLGSILQPFNITVYTLGFFILILGASIYFIGSILPENSKFVKGIFQMTFILVIFLIIIVLTIYLSPILVQ
jgi:hypothetical protein